MNPQDLAATFLALKSLGIVGICAFVALIVVNILKAQVIPINVPPQWRPLVAGTIALVGAVALFLLSNNPILITAAFSVLAFFVPAGAHATFSKATGVVEPKPQTITNTDELAEKIANAMPTRSMVNNTVLFNGSESPEQVNAAVAAMPTTPPPRPEHEVPVPAPGGSS